IDAERSRSKEFVFVTASSKMTSEVRVIPAGRPASEPVVIAPREQGHEYYVDHGGDLFYIRSNSGNAKNFRILTAKTSDPRRDKWTEIVRHKDDVMIEDLLVFSDH